MKSKFLLVGLGLVALLTAPEVKSQITIDASDFPTPQVPHRDTYIWGTNETAFSAPAEGANLVWDYQGITTVGDNADFGYFTTADPFFSTTHHYEAGFVALSNFRIRSDNHFGLDNFGYYAYGWELHDTTFSLAAVTGGVSDEVHFVGHKEYFDGDNNIVRFPMTYGYQWIDTVGRSTPFEITVGLFGLNNVQGVSNRELIYDNEVVGHGKLLMTHPSNMASDSMDVLLVKTVRQTVDSFFVGGQPAPAQLLNGLSLTQGGMATTVNYFFYRKGYGDLVLELEAINANPGSALEAIRYNENSIVEAPPVGIAEHLNSNISMYPNPVQAGRVLSIALETNAKFGNARLLTADGRVVCTESAISSGKKLQLNLPESIPAGIYFVEVLDDTGSLLVTKPVSVTQ